MVTWNNLDKLASFEELKKVERVNLAEVMSGENGAASSPLTVRFYFFIDTSLFQCSNGFYKMKNKGKEVDIERKYRLLFVGTLEQIKKVLLRFVDMCLQTSYS